MGVRYGDIVEHLKRVRNFWDAEIVAIDATGARPIVELARGAGLWVQPVTITSGGPDAISFDSDYWMNVSKAALVTTLDAVLTARELFFADDSIPGIQALKRELGAFRMIRSATGAPRWNGAGSTHDDLIAATQIGIVVTRHHPANRMAVQQLLL